MYLLVTLTCACVYVCVPVRATHREELDESTERADEYGLGPREGLQEAVEAVIATLGMQPCEGTEVVAPNARSHTVLLAGLFVGNQQVGTAGHTYTYSIALFLHCLLARACGTVPQCSLHVHRVTCSP